MADTLKLPAGLCRDDTVHGVEYFTADTVRELIAADRRARQGELAGYLEGEEFYQVGSLALSEYIKASGEPLYRATTKAAAPADAPTLVEIHTLRRLIECAEKLDECPRPMCRDCADEDGTCPNSGLECDMRKLFADAKALHNRLARRASSVPAIPGTVVVLYTNSRELADVVHEGGGILTVDGKTGKYFDTMLAAPSHPSEAKAGEPDNG